MERENKQYSLEDLAWSISMRDKKPVTPLMLQMQELNRYYSTEQINYYFKKNWMK